MQKCSRMNTIYSCRILEGVLATFAQLKAEGVFRWLTGCSQYLTSYSPGKFRSVLIQLEQSLWFIFFSNRQLQLAQFISNCHKGCKQFGKVAAIRFENSFYLGTVEQLIFSITMLGNLSSTCSSLSKRPQNGFYWLDWCFAEMYSWPLGSVYEPMCCFLLYY